MVAHGMILQEMENGNVDWMQTDKIEKIRSHNTQRVWQPSGVRTQGESGDKVMLCKSYNKGTCRFEKQAEHSDKGVVYQHYCSNCFTVTGKKYEHAKHQCLRLRNDKKGQTSNRV